MSDVVPDSSGIRAVLRRRSFRRLWIALGLASLGDWAGLLAVTAMANALADGYADRNFAIAGVLFLRLLPALVIGPLGGYVADRLDRRTTLVTGLALRAVVFASIPLVGTLEWLFVATVVIESVNLVWLPTKDATIPSLVSRGELPDANRLNLVTTYGSAVPAAGMFVLLTVLTEMLHSTLGWFEGSPVDLPMYANAVLLAVASLFCLGLHDVPRGSTIAPEDQLGVIRTITQGWSYVRTTPLVRGLVVGIVGAFAAGGVVIGLGRVFVADLGADDPGYGVLFGAVFAGLGVGMWKGPSVAPRVSRRRTFGLALIASGVALLLIAAIPNMVLAALFAALLGCTAGVAWITGYTLLGLEVDEALRGRTFAFVQSMIRLALAAVLALAPFVAGLVGRHRFRVNADVTLTYSGAQFTLLGAAVLAVAVGVSAYRQMDDRPGVSLASELRHRGGEYTDRGVFIALEGGEGAGKSTQTGLLCGWLEGAGHDVLLTHEPGATEVGVQVRRIVLSPETGELSSRTEALLYAADKAEHVDRVVRPALERGSVVVTDRYVDSALAYQGAGRDLDRAELESVARWATTDLRPHLTVLLDADPAVAMARFAERDRLEAEPLEFHQRVREAFLALAAADPDHYLVVDAARDAEDIAAQVRARVEPLLTQAQVRA